MNSELQDNGYLVLNGALSRCEPFKLMNRLTKSYKNEWDDVWSPDNRIHITLEIKDEFKKLLSEIIKLIIPIIPELYEEESLNYLAEFASITSFPNSNAQVWHRDSRDSNGLLFTAFVNLMEVSKDVGPLQVVRGSHKEIKLDSVVKKNDIKTLELEPMSVVIMDSRLIHRGSSNTSKNKIRPVIYASFGRIDLHDPGYHIRQEYQKYGNLRISDLFN